MERAQLSNPDELSERERSILALVLKMTGSDPNPVTIGVIARVAAPLAVNDLTPRETEVVILTLAGLRTKEVADEMGIRERTVTTFKTSIYTKFHVTTAIELAHLLNEPQAMNALRAHASKIKKAGYRHGPR